MSDDIITVAWRKSSYSNGQGGNCVEVADLSDGGRLVRDTKEQGRGSILRFTAREWQAFMLGVKDGEFD